VKLGTFDLNQGTLDRIHDGEQLFAIDQQPYERGCLAVSLPNGYVNFGLKVPTTPILTGPGIVDAANIEATLAGAPPVHPVTPLRRDAGRRRPGPRLRARETSMTIQAMSRPALAARATTNGFPSSRRQAASCGAGR